MTHDQSFPGPSGTSVNMRTQHDQLPPIVYGFCLKRVIHFIFHLRANNPKSKIFISKFDFDAAYRRCHMSSETAQESLTIHDGYLLMALRLTFGGSPCPNLWGCLCEATTDLCNALILNKHWDHTILHDPLTSSLNIPQSLPDSIPFAKSKHLSVLIPSNNIGKSDVFIDDIIAISLDKEDNINRVFSAAILAIHTVTRPLDPSDEILRKEIISMKKFQAEGSPSEVKTVLGWSINTRLLRIYLPPEKYTDWNNDMNSYLSNPKMSKNNMETLIGRLDHVASLMEMLRHFMNRLRNALQRSIKSRFTTLTLQELEDLVLLQHFIYVASSKGIPLNNLVFCNPAHLYRSDSSLHGLGGYSILTGKAWRFEIPPNLRLRASLNSLEFIALLITVWVDHLDNKIKKESCILSQSDSTSPCGWIKKSNFSNREDSYIQLTTGKKIASIILDCEGCLYSQWFPGEMNEAADACS